MKRPVTLLLLLIALGLSAGSCRKLVEDQKREMLLQAMTDGQWHIETYQEGPATITDQFTGYRFQFYEDGKVTCLKGALALNGTWIGDLQNLSITSAFPSASDPLKKLNGTWKIKDTGRDFVTAESDNGLGKNVLHLRKNP